ncbi:hypothetical protein A6R70_14630 [Agrobacterium rubi]|uniref:hypothetical protein n=1 Tax=Agrobacterium rubi TaxID=28099 RepID=UPI00201B7A2E|nr:hypothetical protein [Agrobacterium rubi]MCL6653525.1 hypothetical protein [Agrobacterium rubi]
MSNKYRAEQYISISASESGTEIELQMVVDFTVHSGSKATLVDPEELPMAEIDQVQCFLVKSGKPSAVEAAIPAWAFNAICDTEEFQNWMLSEAAEQHEAAADEHADQRREMMREERL